MHGKLYRCPFSASLDAINSVDFSKNDYLDLTDDNNLSEEKLINFLNKKNQSFPVIFVRVEDLNLIELLRQYNLKS